MTGLGVQAWVQFLSGVRPALGRIFYGAFSSLAGRWRLLPVGRSGDEFECHIRRRRSIVHPGMRCMSGAGSSAFPRYIFARHWP
jgi:hypothetical protein